MMKKILWLCNTMLPDLFGRFHTYSVKEGWLVGISDEIKRQGNIEFHYACPQMNERRIVNIKNDSISFHCFYTSGHDSYTVEENVREQIGKIISQVKPDIIHIFGTEMPHSAACVECAPQKEKIVISIQGLVSEYAKHYLNGIPHWAYLEGGFCGGRYQTILSQHREFCKRAENEFRAIRGVKHVIGRTEWDKACVNRINSRCQYHYCSETLRNVFYEEQWQINKIERHTIFVSQGDYPIKGLHHLLAALPSVIKKYPDTKVYVAGEKAFLEDGSPYGRYIQKMIGKKGLNQYISFLGMIDQDKICHQLLKTHVTVMPSNIENSPNSIGEAMLLGTPVIAAFVGGIPSILKHETEGLLYQPDSSSMLSYYICKVFEDDLFARNLSINGRKRAEKLYDRENNLQQLLEIYDSI